MKKTITWIILICIALSCSACGSSKDGEENKGSAFVPDISIDQIEWSVDAGTIKGENYVLGKVVNNSPFVITSLKISFTEKQGISEADKASFYADIQKSQGFDEVWMTEYIESREKLSQPISMYFKIYDTIEIGAEKEQVKCYYMGGWTSKNVVYPDLFVPEIATIEYEKEGVQYTLYYNFSSKKYDLEKAE